MERQKNFVQKTRCTNASAKNVMTVTAFRAQNTNYISIVYHTIGGGAGDEVGCNCELSGIVAWYQNYLFLLLA